jgi:hypothetical protein
MVLLEAANKLQHILTCSQGALDDSFVNGLVVITKVLLKHYIAAFVMSCEELEGGW